MSIAMSYGSFQFDPQPIPLISYNKNFIKTPDGTPIGTTFDITLEGTIVEVTGNVSGIISVADEMQRIRTGFRNDGELFSVSCAGLPFFSGYARVNSIQFDKSDNNWVFTAPYTIELETDVLSTGENDGLIPPNYITDYNEEWTIEFLEDKALYSWELPHGFVEENSYQFRVTHNVSAKGKTAYNGDGLIKPSWQQARDYVLPKIGFDKFILENSGLVVSGTYAPYNHVRSNQIIETDGTFAVTESWLVFSAKTLSSLGKATEEFNITTRTSIDNGLTTSSIEGTIQGLAQTCYTRRLPGNPSGYIETTGTKYSNASGYWKNVRSLLYYRAYEVSRHTSTRPLNLTPISTTVGYSPTNGTITYAYEYNDRPSVCIAGALQEVITISDNYPVDVFASLVVLGRAAGPVLQQLGTYTAPTRTITVDVVMQPSTGCIVANGVKSFLKSRPYWAVDNIVSEVRADLVASYGQVFRQNDTDNWDATLGKYNRTVTWTYMNCS